MNEADTMLETMLKLDWNKIAQFQDPLSALNRIGHAIPLMESNCYKGYYDEAFELCKQIYAETMSVEQAAAYWREVVISTKDEWYASVQMRKHKEYIEERVPVLYREPINPTLLPNPDAYRQVMNWMAHINGDVYHMQSEEQHIGEALLETGDRLVNLHMADSNRCVLGQGSLDLDTIIMALYLIGFNAPDRFVTPEPLGPGGDPYPAMNGKPDKKALDKLVQQTVSYFREREEALLANE